MLKNIAKVAGVTYSCSLKGVVGLCATDKPGTLYRHKFTVNPPILYYDTDRKRWGFRCKVRFMHGPMAPAVGIMDYEGKEPACELRPAKPNPDDLLILGELVHTSFRGKDDGLQFKNSVLACTKDGEHLHILDIEDLPPGSKLEEHSRVEELLQAYEGKKNPVQAIREGPKKDLRGTAKELADLGALIKYNSSGVLDNLLAAEEHLSETPGANPISASCVGKHLRLACRHHGRELVVHLRAHGDHEKAKRAEEFHRELDGFIENPNVNAGTVRNFRNRFRAEFMPETHCTSGICSLDQSSRSSRSGKTSKGVTLPATGLVLFHSKTCTHCARTIKHLRTSGLRWVGVDCDDHEDLCEKIKDVPTLVAYEKGEELGRLVGERSVREIREFHEEVGL